MVHTGVVATPRQRRRPVVDEGDQRHRHHAAARRVPEGGGVAKLVVQSLASVYGAGPRDPAKFTEEMVPRAPRGPASARTPSRSRPTSEGSLGAGPTSGDHAEAGEPDRCRGGQQRHPLLVDAGGAEGARVRRPAAVPPPAMRRGDAEGHRGRHPGHLQRGRDDIVTLSQALGMLGRPGIGIPQSLAPFIAAGFRQARLSDFSADQIDALTYGRGMEPTGSPGPPGLRLRTAVDPHWREFAASAPAGNDQPGADRRRVGVAEAGARGRSDANGGRPWLTPRSSNWAAEVPPAGAAGPARRRLPGPWRPKTRRVRGVPDARLNRPRSERRPRSTRRTRDRGRGGSVGGACRGPPGRGSAHPVVERPAR